MILRGAVIADIHFENKRYKRLKNELYKVFIPWLEEQEDLHFLAFAGDLVDHKLSFNDEAVFQLQQFMKDVAAIATRKKIKVRVIRGTKNHDINQLKNFMHYETEEGLDFRIINTVTSETLVFGKEKIKVLYLPEEYMENPDEYYADFFDKKYDICVGHGTFNVCAHASKTQESEKPMKNAPTFKFKEMSAIVDGPIFFGHVHTRLYYKGKLFIPGSFSRWAFGEEEPKGFSAFQYATKKKEFRVQTVVNKYAKKYITLELDEELKALDSVDDKVKLIEERKKAAKAHFLRVKIDKSLLNDEADLGVLQEYFSKDDAGVKLNFSNAARAADDDKSLEIMKKYEFVFKGELEMHSLLAEYLKVHDNIIINEDVIKRHIYEDEKLKERG